MTASRAKARNRSATFAQGVGLLQLAVAVLGDALVGHITGAYTVVELSTGVMHVVTVRDAAPFCVTCNSDNDDHIALATDTLTRSVVSAGGLEGISPALLALVGQEPPKSILHEILYALCKIAKDDLGCSEFEFVGGILCRTLWVLPRTEIGLERNAFRRLAIEAKSFLESEPEKRKQAADHVAQ